MTSFDLPNPPGHPFWNEFNRAVSDISEPWVILYRNSDYGFGVGIGLYNPETDQGHAFHFSREKLRGFGRKDAKAVAFGLKLYSGWGASRVSKWKASRAPAREGST